MATVTKEAALSEVLAEVSMLDLGKVVKRTLSSLGCLALFLLISAVLGSGVEGGVHYAMPELHVPSWLIWLAIAWFWIGMLTADKSYHDWEMSWYFPKLRWRASLLLAAYLVGGFEIYVAVLGMNQSAARVLAAAASYFYLLPLWVSISVINVGHAKLMEKRQAAAILADD
jgi:hypothetical protein